MCLMMPLNHAYFTNNRVGETIFADVMMPAWLESLQYVLCKIITACIPSAFALIAGVLLFRKPFVWRENVVRKARTLLLPLLLISSAWIALYAVGPDIPGLGRLFSSESVRVADWTPREWFAAYFGWTQEHEMPTIIYPLWFLRDLMLMNLIAPTIRRAVDRAPGMFLFVLTALLVWQSDHFIFHFTIHQVFIFFSLGCYVVRYNLRLSDLDRIPKGKLAALYALLVAVSFLQRGQYQGRGLTNLLGVLVLARFCSQVPNGKWGKRLLWLSQYGIAIYFFHERFLTFFKKIALRMLPTALPTTLFVYYALPMLVAALCVLMAWLMRRLTPRVYALLTGSR